MVPLDARSRKVALFYNRLAPFYPLIDVFLRAHKRALVSAVNSISPERLLEIGVGRGTHLRSYRAHSLVGIDVSEGMLARARKAAPAGTRLLQMDARKLSFADGSFDCVVVSHVLAVVPDSKGVIREAARVLRSGGSLVVLNHFTPANGLQYIDRLFHWVGMLFGFRSVFRAANLVNVADALTLSSERTLGVGGYYKLLIFSKA